MDTQSPLTARGASVVLSMRSADANQPMALLTFGRDVIHLLRKVRLWVKSKFQN
jgi:hypothetical protein